MDSAQALKAALRALADRKTFAGGIHLAVSGRSTPQPSKLLFQEHFKTVFLDGSGWVNIAGHVSQSQLAEVCVIGLRFACYERACMIVNTSLFEASCRARPETKHLHLCKSGATCRKAEHGSPCKSGNLRRNHGRCVSRWVHVR
jgi:hypothetical protein